MAVVIVSLTLSHDALTYEKHEVSVLGFSARTGTFTKGFEQSRSINKAVSGFILIARFTCQ